MFKTLSERLLAWEAEDNREGHLDSPAGRGCEVRQTTACRTGADVRQPPGAGLANVRFAAGSEGGNDPEAEAPERPFVGGRRLRSSGGTLARFSRWGGVSGRSGIVPLQRHQWI